MARNILILTTWAFNDGLVQSAVLPYIEMIRQIDPETSFYLVTSELGDFPELDHPYIKIIAFKQYNFGFKKLFQSLQMFLRLQKITRKRDIAIVHCFCPPAAVYGYMLSKLSNVPLLLDSYEPHAEAMTEGGTWQRNSLAFRILFNFEKWQTKRAAAIVSCTQGMTDYARKKYGVVPQNFFVKPACVNLALFYFSDDLRQKFRNKLGYKDEVVCIYVGKLGGHYLDKELFDFLKCAIPIFEGKLRLLMLTGDKPETISLFARESQVDSKYITILKAPYAEVNGYLNAADFAINLNKPVPSKRYGSPIKTGEYWAAGLPILIPKNISDDSHIINTEKIGHVFNSLDEDGYNEAANSMKDILLTDKAKLKNQIREVAIRFRGYQIAEKVYSKLFGSGSNYFTKKS